jgi:hypothetical protein
MAEAIAALGLAANIVQFIGFGTKVLSTGHSLYKSGSGKKFLDENQEIKIITQSLNQLVKGLTSSEASTNPSSSVSQTEINLRNLAAQCNDIASELLRAVGKLDIEGKSGRWDSFRTALKSVLAESKIEKIRQRLDKFRQEIIVHILACFR